MSKIVTTIPVTDLRQDTNNVLKSLKARKQAAVITQRGRAAAVILSVEAYKQSEAERRILLLLARGEKEIEAGRGHALDRVMAEADTLLTGDPV